MRIAIFGRTIESGTHRELFRFIDRIRLRKDVEWSIYTHFYNYLKNTLLEHYNGSDEAHFSISEVSNFIDTLAKFASYSDLPSETDLMLSLGGDGTFLSTLPIIRDKDIAVAGVNFGRLGFLTSADSTSEWIDSLLNGDFQIQQRSLLELEYNGLQKDFYGYALNEFSIQRDGPAVLEMDIKVNGASMPRYMADGVLIGSPTGSTAYSMSAGGPIVMPDCEVLTIVPVAPHNLNIRPLVVSWNSEIEISFTTRYDNATLSADNRSFKIPNGATVRIRKAPISLKVVLPKMNFMTALSKKLFWGADWRNL